ncbi:MAG: NADPH-dependent 7-cyano-7-deazaguanine reductase QueF [Pseudomonadota bacterium]
MSNKTDFNYLFNSPLGKNSEYSDQYNPELLFAIPRQAKREEIGISSAALPFKGFDIWNAFELSWLNAKGKPIVAILRLHYPCDSPNIVESKSLKLYLNAFHQTRFSSWENVYQHLQQDLSASIGTQVSIHLHPLNQLAQMTIQAFEGICLDDLDIHCDNYTVNSAYLSAEPDTLIEEIIYSDLLKSNCPITGQPDWASIQIHYRGAKMNHQGLLKYIISFRQHQDFHEQCIERIFVDIMRYCKPDKLSVYGRYTRRGGIDINPIRSTDTIKLPLNSRLARQ